MHTPATSVLVKGNPVDPSAQLLAGWLSSCLGLYVPVEKAEGKYISSVEVRFGDDYCVTLRNDGYKLIMSRPGQMDSIAPFPNRSTGDVLAEELRRLDPDEPYAQALGAVTGQHDLNSRPPSRVHIWKDPALASQEA
jgi:glucose-6-phosphate dehydrogenase assembly protein OpcA